MRERILALPVGGPDAPSTRYRLLMLMPQLLAAGLRVRVSEPGEGRFQRSAKNVLGVLNLLGVGLVFIQKRVIPSSLLWFITRAGLPMVFDIDDAIFVDPINPDSSSAHIDRIEDIVRCSSLVIAGNAYLASWVRSVGGKVRIIPTGVDVRRWNPAVIREHEGVVLGWIGTSSNLWHLEALAEPLTAALAAVPTSRLVVVCDRQPSFEHPAMEFRAWALDTELESVSDFDIGLMPLSDDAWTRGKCAFKALQCMALGLPVVASAVGANLEVIENGRTGVLVRDNREWVEELVALMRSSARRLTIGSAAREAVVARFDVEIAGAELAVALQGVLDSGRR